MWVEPKNPLFVNPEDLEQVLQTMQEEEGLTDEELTRRYYKCYGKLISKCRRKIGGVSMLLANYDRLIETWEGEKCVLTGNKTYNVYFFTIYALSFDYSIDQVGFSSSQLYVVTMGMISSQDIELRIVCLHVHAFPSYGHIYDHQ